MSLLVFIRADISLLTQLETTLLAYRQADRPEFLEGFVVVSVKSNLAVGLTRAINLWGSSSLPLIFNTKTINAQIEFTRFEYSN